jgi:hypothetical protein
MTRLLSALLLLFASGLIPPSLRADDTQDALRLLPANALAVLRIDHPRQILDRFDGHVKRLGLLQFDEVKEFLDSTQMKRLEQLLLHLEKTFGRPWPKLLEDLTDRGVTLAIIPGKDQKNTRVLGVVRARDTKLLSTVYTTTLLAMTFEAAQADTPLKVKTTSHQGATVTSFGPDFHVARQGEHLFFSNKDSVLRDALDQLHSKSGKSILDHSNLKLADRPVNGETLAWGWVDLAPLKKYAGEELDKIKLPTSDILPHLVVGGLFDAYLRSDHVWFAVTDDGRGPALEIISPAGRAKSQEGSRALHMHDPASPGILPTLHPPGTVYSTSFYWDLAAVYNQRTAIYKQDALKEFEEGEKKVKPFLGGNSLGQLFNHFGARHRVVVTRYRDSGYTMKPKTPYPAFAFVAECRDADKFYKAIALPLRGAGFFLSTQVSTKLIDVTHGGSKIVSYRFTENDKNKNYEQGILFNFTPCFTRVGDFVIFSSNLDLCRDLIDELQKTPSAGRDEADARHHFSWSAFGEALAAQRDFIATELTLRHGGAITEIEKQIEKLLRLLDNLGTVEASVSHSPQFKLEFRAKYKPQ